MGCVDNGCGLEMAAIRAGLQSLQRERDLLSYELHYPYGPQYIYTHELHMCKKGVTCTHRTFTFYTHHRCLSLSACYTETMVAATLIACPVVIQLAQFVYWD